MVDMKKMLRAELRQYKAVIGHMTTQEQNDLRLWVADGNSVYSNPHYLSGEDGAPLDYIAASRIIDDMVDGMGFDESPIPF